jgi:hypothetical protein
LYLHIFESRKAIPIKVVIYIPISWYLPLSIIDYIANAEKKQRLIFNIISMTQRKILLIRTWWSIDHVYDTKTELPRFDEKLSPVIRVFWEMYSEGISELIDDRRIAGVNSSDLTDDHIKEIVRIIDTYWRGKHVVLTSGTGAIIRIAKAVRSSGVLNKIRGQESSTPSVIQAATAFPWFLWHIGDIYDVMYKVKLELDRLGIWNHTIATPSWCIIPDLYNTRSDPYAIPPDKVIIS